MATDVTVLGVGGTTLTIASTGNDVASAMQKALGVVSSLVQSNTLTQVNYTGGSTLPGIATALGGVIATGASTVPLSPFGLGGQFVSGVLGGAAAQTAIVNFGATNAVVAMGTGGSTISSGTTVTGAGGGEVDNLGANTQVFFGGAANQTFREEGGSTFGGTATAWVTTPLRGSATFDDSNGSTTINLDTVASTLTVAHPFGQTLILLNSGDGQTTINVASTPTVAGTVVDGDALSFRGTSSVATTVNAAGSSVTGLGGNTEWDLLKSGSAFINGDGSNIILFPTGSGVSATLFGGSGTDIDAGAGGLIEAGSGGNSVLFGSTVAGSTTLMGGGSGDVLVQQSTNNMFITGKGNELLFGLASGDLYQEGVSGANAATIGGFTSGTDSISLANPAGGSYSLLGNSTTAPTPSQVDFQYTNGNTVISFGDGTKWTVLGTQERRAATSTKP